MLGYTRGGTQIHRFTSAGINNFGYNSNVTLIHNTFVHVTVTATNTAELVGVSYSDPIHVDLTPPDIVQVYDGRSSSKTCNSTHYFTTFYYKRHTANANRGTC